MPRRTYLLHRLPIAFEADEALVDERLHRYWRAFDAGELSPQSPMIVQLQVEELPPAPPSADPISTGPDVSYYLIGDELTVFFPGWGSFDMALPGNVVHGHLARRAVMNYGVFEDMILVALAPMLRRRGYFTLHAFAAAVEDRALLILGDSGAGKTTTGLSLLARGARLLSNDAPLLHMTSGQDLSLHAYPGLISAYPDTLARFPHLADRLATRSPDERGKIAFAADDIWPEVWAWQAQPAALVFPHITPGLARSHLEPMTAFGALQRLISQSIENWDAETIPAQLRILRELVASTPAYYLHLAPDIPALPDLLLPLCRK